MRFCQPHWNKLRAEIERVGLGKFVSADGHEAIAKTVASIERADLGDPPRQSEFDPLLNAHWAIVSNVMGVVGFAIMVQNDDGSDRCPLCFITADHLANCTMPDCKIRDYDHWIGRVAEDQVAHAKELGLMGDA